MKVAWIVPGFTHGEEDWAAPVLVDVARALVQRVELHVFALRYPRRGRYTLEGVEVHSLGLDPRGVGRSYLLAVALREVVAEHRRSPFDAVHGLWCDEPGFVAAAAGRLLRRPSIVSVMGGELLALTGLSYGGRLSLANRFLAPLALCGASHLTAASSPLEALVRASPGGRHRPAHRLVWGIDPSLFEPGAAARSGSFYVLHVGSLQPIKDQVTLLRAFALVRAHAPEAHLHIAGEGPLRPTLAALVEQLGLKDAVTFHGWLQRAALGHLYRKADVLAISSLHEAQHVAALEAGLCGLPVVSTAVGLPVDLAAEGAARVVPNSDPAALADALLALRDPAQRCRLGERLKGLVRSRYLAEHTAGQLMTLYGGCR